MNLNKQRRQAVYHLFFFPAYKIKSDYYPGVRKYYIKVETDTQGDQVEEGSRIVVQNQ